MSRRLRRRKHPRLLPRLLLICLIVLFLSHRSSQNDSSPAPLALAPEAAETIAVYLAAEKTILEMDLEDYLCHVVAAEMPASFHEEALRAQAVAARSYTCFRRRSYGGGGCASHPEADICTSAACCQAYAAQTVDPLVRQAVMTTAGELLLYDGQVINALYHASSGGHTEDVEAVFSEALPYLRSVSSPGEEAYPQYAAQSVFSRSELTNLFDIDKNAPLAGQFEVMETDASGRAVSIRVGSHIMNGTDFRRVLSLPSTRIALSFEGDSMIVSTTGFGHGVGLSQTGADAMARRGAGYREILLWYYTGCEISS